MKKFLTSLALVFSFGMASVDVEAAKRFGGGSNVGKQRAAPTQKEATPAPASPHARPQFAGIGAALPENRATPFQANQTGSASGAAPAMAAAPAAAAMPADFETAPFLRVAKSSFIRLQAANDAGDLDDIRDYTTPEMFAEISMQVSERGGVTQKTEVVNVEAQLVEVVTEGGYDIASVRFYGLMREAPGANPESFDETWHVRRKAGDRKDAWLIAGIQQNQ